MIITLPEILDMIIMTAFIGFIFKDFLRPAANYHYQDPLQRLQHSISSRGMLDGFWFAALVTAPAIILHEFGHKIVAMLFGMVAFFKAAYMWLGLGVLLKLMNFGFIFFVPAYVTWGCPTRECMAGLAANPWIGSAIAFAGPGVNLLLWLASMLVVKKNLIKRRYLPAAILIGRINMFLFIFNMLPIPPFDGFHVFSGILKTMF